MKLATLCYVKDSNKTLMLQRAKKPNDVHEGKWNGLGGKLETDESPRECAIREVYEESGLHVEELELKGVLTFPSFANEEAWYVFVYVITKWNGVLQESSEGSLHWIRNEDLLHLPLWEGDKYFLPYLNTPGVFTGKFTYEDGVLTDFTLEHSKGIR
jgi:8-oxo-dGTP diphosphatase